MRCDAVKADIGSLMSTVTTSPFGTAPNRRTVGGLAVNRSAFPSRIVGPANNAAIALSMVSATSRATGVSNRAADTGELPSTR